jgi:hypothetical protein
VGAEIGYIGGQPELAQHDAFLWLIMSIPYRLKKSIILKPVPFKKNHVIVKNHGIMKTIALSKFPSFSKAPSFIG